MRVAVYARVSTEHEAQINALGNQLEWYKIEGSRHSDWEIVEVYVDQGITGTQAQKRPEFLHMIEDAKKGKFDLIITREVSRFARNTVDTLSYIRELKAVGVNLFFINDGINTATDYGELRLTIMSSLAQDESRKISERVKAGQEISREKHVLYGNGNILGYRRENGTYVPDPDQAQTVKLIYQMYSTGKVGLQKVAAELYRLGRLDASGHVSWDASKVSRVLHNATYKGCMQNFVGGLIECITLSDTGSEVTLVCNDEGKLLGLPLNRPLWDGADVLAGPGFLAGCDNEGNLTSLPQSAMDFYKEKFRAFIIEI